MHTILNFPDPNSHLIHVESVYQVHDNQPFTLQLATWRPGRYEHQNYARNITFFKIKNNFGKNVSFNQVNTNQWEIYPEDDQEIHVFYQYYANQPDAGGSWFKEDLVYINFINLLLYRKGSLHTESCTVLLNLDSSYILDCALEIKCSKNIFLLSANSLMHIFDSPLLASTSLKLHNFNVGGVNIFLSFFGNITPIFNDLEKDFSKFIKIQIEIFGIFPETEYHFQFILPCFNITHGVEHSKSTVIFLGNLTDFNFNDNYIKLLSISSHEFFHAWNICKIRPKNLQPYHFSKSQFFEEGFVVEGVTTYYGDLCLLKSKVWTFDTFITEFLVNVENHFHSSARESVSLMDSKFFLWVDGYQPSNLFRKVSIYDKGAIAAFILDIKIRKITNNIFSLDDVMLKLWTNYGANSDGYTTQDYKTIIEQICESNFDTYFESVIFGTLNLENDLKSSFEYLGFELKFLPTSNFYEHYFGFKMTASGRVTAIDIESPASHIFNLDDLILEINNINVSEINTLVESKNIEVRFLRFNDLYIKNITSNGNTYFLNPTVIQLKNPTEEQNQNFKLFCKL